MPWHAPGGWNHRAHYHATGQSERNVCALAAAHFCAKCWLLYAIPSPRFFRYSFPARLTPTFTFGDLSTTSSLFVPQWFPVAPVYRQGTTSACFGPGSLVTQCRVGFKHTAIDNHVFIRQLDREFFHRALIAHCDCFPIPGVRIGWCGRFRLTFPERGQISHTAICCNGFVTRSHRSYVIAARGLTGCPFAEAPLPRRSAAHRLILSPRPGSIYCNRGPPMPALYFCVFTFCASTFLRLRLRSIQSPGVARFRSRLGAIVPATICPAARWRSAIAPASPAPAQQCLVCHPGWSSSGGLRQRVLLRTGHDLASVYRREQGNERIDVLRLLRLAGVDATNCALWVWFAAVETGPSGLPPEGVRAGRHRRT